jgi:hypothetical protein
VTHLPAVVVVAEFAVEEDFMVGCVLAVFTAVACAWREDLGHRIQ